MEHWLSLFQLTSLICVEKIELENPAILEVFKQCEQTERFSAIAKGNDYFLSLDAKSKRRYKVKINKMQQYDPYQIKKEELSGNISKFPPMQWHNVGRIKNVRKFEDLQSLCITMGQGSKNKTVFNLPAEFALVIGRIST